MHAAVRYSDRSDHSPHVHASCGRDFGFDSDELDHFSVRLLKAPVRLAWDYRDSHRSQRQRRRHHRHHHQMPEPFFREQLRHCLVLVVLVFVVALQISVVSHQSAIHLLRRLPRRRSRRRHDNHAAFLA